MEFFELFKVPWEFYVNGKAYNVVIIAGRADIIPAAKLLIVFGSERRPSDVCQMSQMDPARGGVLVECKGYKFPVYLKTALFDSSLKPVMKALESAGVVGVEYEILEQRLIRTGYDLFDEVEYLLTQGQPVEHAEIPTLEMHINVLREWIIGSGFVLVEIPSVPSGYGFIVCLTHDVDFINIRDHQPVDRSVIGFIARSIAPRNLRNTRSQIAWRRIVKNLRALLTLPAVYLGLSRDIWFDIDRYMDLERGLGSTFYFIPLKGHAGKSIDRKDPPWRAASYDVTEYRALIEDLKLGKAEIGVHGLDAWQNSTLGAREAAVIRSLSGEKSVGIRMHWLYFSQETPKMLEEGGFDYDSTIGYNESNGFRSGTTQVFCLPGSSKLLELPLNVMDTALFYSGRMGLSEAAAMDLCKQLISIVKFYGGVLTINWHTRSLSPERNWDSFYVELLDIFRMERVWFATARAAVEWFRKRRQIRFENVEVTSRGVKVKLRARIAPDSPGFTLRVHRPAEVGEARGDRRVVNGNWIDVPVNDEQDIEVSL